ncbi:MAG: DUF1080 domain-containing protein [Balneolaceae bacterium]|nr:DUF1080 domain-containing protein [Balneolaceae bacterium]
MIFNERIKIQIAVAIAAGLLLFLGCGNNEGSQQEVTGDTETISLEMENDFESIFNGSDLTGWDGDPRFWRVEDGAIVGETSEDNPTEKNTFLIWEEGEPSNFEIRFQYRFGIVSADEYGNSGIQIRSERFGDDEDPNLRYRVRGYQPDFAISDWIPGIMYEEQARGILARRGERVLIDADGESHTERFADEEELGESIEHTNWNDYQVYANGDTIRTYINGNLTHELIDQSPEASHEGILAFQIHSGPPMRIDVRNIELKMLD